MGGTQMSMFSLLDEWETPEIQIEEQKAGVKGWVIEFSGIFLKENGFREDWHGVETRQIVFEEDTYMDSNGDWTQMVRSIKGPHFGWLANARTVFRSRPTWNDCLKYARENRRKSDPEDTRYYSEGPNGEKIYSYEEGA